MSDGPPPGTASTRGPIRPAHSLAEPARKGLAELVASLGQAPCSVEEQLVHGALVTLVLRVVFLLMTEHRGLGRASLVRLHAELAASGEGEPGQLAGCEAAWPRLRGLFRSLDARGAALFAPVAAPLLEQGDLAFSDRTLLGLLDRLLVVDGERLDYAALDAEALGSAYEGLLGYLVRRASGPSVRIEPGGPVVLLDRLASLPSSDRVEWLEAEFGAKLAQQDCLAIVSARHADDLARALTRRKGSEPLPAGSWYLAPTQARRRSGAHYTSVSLTRDLVGRTLAPLLGGPAAPEQILGLRVCDPAMGSGAFLVEACRQLADALSRERAARRQVAETCLYGVDRDPLAVNLARLSLWLVVGADDCPLSFVDHALRCGNALVGLSRRELVTGRLALGPSAARGPQVELWQTASGGNVATDDGRCRDVGDLLLARWLGGSRAAERRRRWAETVAQLPRLWRNGLTRAEAAEVEAVRARYRPFHWELELDGVFGGGRGGFDAVVGNPPWVAYAGRAAQPLAPELRDFYLETSPAFAGYRTLQGLFVDRAATLLRPGGRLGLVVPTSMSDLGGYEPVRRAHAALFVPDPDLPDYGDAAFFGVFQPSMGLVSTRRPEPLPSPAGHPWPLVRPDLEAAHRHLLSVLEERPKLPPHLFGERGYQTRRSDLREMCEVAAPEGRFSTPLRTGTEVEPFRARPPRLFCDRSALSGRFRSDEDWQRVGLLIRQTARFPLAAWGDGLPFRNSILAGFGDDQFSPSLLLAWLNSSPVRWFHYHKQRDARQGMPQVKIAHLRDLPAPPRDARVTRDLAALGHQLGRRNRGVSSTEQRRLDELVVAALGLSSAEVGLVGEWADQTRG